MEAKTKDLWVFVETNTDGSAKKVGIELLRQRRTEVLRKLVWSC